MLIRVDHFAGVLPRAEPQLLGASFAQEAVNCKLWSRNLRPYFGVQAVAGASLFKSGSGIIDSLFRFGVDPSDVDTAGHFFHWQGIAHASRVPVAGDTQWTTIITGDGAAPRLAALDVSVAGPDQPTFTEPLGLPVPDVSGTVATVQGSADAGGDPDTDGVSRDYVIAYVNSRGHLGPTSNPVPASGIWLPGQTVDITGLPSVPQGNYNVTAKRIYRLGAAGTKRYFVAEVGPQIVSFTDNVDEISLGEESSSAEWEEPPADMHGIGVLSNGICYGASKNQVCVSKAYLPYAWSPLDRQTVNYDIVGVGHFGTTIVAISGENPYIIYGYAPENMQQQLLRLNQGGLSEQGIVSGRFGVSYPSKDGLVLVNQGGGQIVTETWFTRDEWQLLKPETFKGALYADRYFAFHDDGVNPGSIIIDPSNPEAGIVFSDVFGTALYSDPVARALYFVQDGNLMQWDTDRSNPLIYKWKSKEFLSMHSVGMNWGRVLADSYANLAVEFWCDGVLQHQQPVTSRTPFPINSGSQKGRIFEFRLTGTDTVTEAAFASSPKEFRR